MIGGKKQVKCPVPITRTSVSWGSTSKRSGNANNSHVCPPNEREGTRINRHSHSLSRFLVPFSKPTVWPRFRIHRSVNRRPTVYAVDRF
jgi:hypothetical protein